MIRIAISVTLISIIISFAAGFWLARQPFTQPAVAYFDNWQHEIAIEHQDHAQILDAIDRAALAINFAARERLRYDHRKNFTVHFIIREE